VVVIDDQPDMVMTLLAILREEGYDAQGFSSARQALKHMSELRPDVVISDLAMPSVSGWDLARQVRQSMGEAGPLLIAISGKYTKVPDKLSAESAGFNYFLAKPCDAEALLALIKPLASGK
jgi:two-component system, chemotaxis family, response regulator PixH